MIIDALDRFSVYPFGPAWKEAFAFLSVLTPDAATGRHAISGDQLFAGIDTYRTKKRAEAKLETHRKYVDIQLLLSGAEVMEVFPRRLLNVVEPYDHGRDAEFYLVPPVAPVRVTLLPGRFVVLFPDDAHMPCLQAGQDPVEVKKVVVKVAVPLLVPV